MPWKSDSLLKTCGHPANREVIAYLQTHHPSAHSDIATELLDAAAAVPERRWFCPDTQSYAYIALHLPNGVIYALAIGMQMLAFRLPETLLPTGAIGSAKKRLRPFAEIGNDWLAFEMFRDGNVADDRALARLLTESSHRWAADLRGGG